MMDDPTPVVWADDGTTWDTPSVVPSEGPQSLVLEPDDRRDLHTMLPASGRVGFTVDPGPRTHFLERHRNDE